MNERKCSFSEFFDGAFAKKWRADTWHIGDGIEACMHMMENDLRAGEIQDVMQEAWDAAREGAWFRDECGCFYTLIDGEMNYNGMVTCERHTVKS